MATPDPRRIATLRTEKKMKRPTLATAVLAIPAMILLSGCGGAESGPPASSGASLEIGKAASVEEVRDAFVAAGGECDWERTDRITVAAESGDCSGRTVISIYATEQDLDDAVSTLRGNTPMKLNLLVGDNWIINSPEAEGMDDVLGGEWITEPLEAEEPEEEVSGSLASPLPKGYVATITRDGDDFYSVQVAVQDADAWPALQQANQFNDPPGPGEKYILVSFTFTGLSSEPVDPSLEIYDYSIATPDGRLFTDAFAVVPGTDLSDSPELYDGQSFTGNVAYLVPADSSSWLVTAFGSYIQL